MTHHWLETLRYIVPVAAVLVSRSRRIRTIGASPVTMSFARITVLGANCYLSNRGEKSEARNFGRTPL